MSGAPSTLLWPAKGIGVSENDRSVIGVFGRACLARMTTFENIEYGGIKLLISIIEALTQIWRLFSRYIVYTSTRN